MDLPNEDLSALHGNGSGGDTGINDDVLREAFDNVEATSGVMMGTEPAVVRNLHN